MQKEKILKIIFISAVILSVIFLFSKADSPVEKLSADASCILATGQVVIKNPCIENSKISFKVQRGNGQFVLLGFNIFVYYDETSSLVQYRGNLPINKETIVQIIGNPNSGKIQIMPVISGKDGDRICEPFPIFNLDKC